jgi:hypothetical protein
MEGHASTAVNGGHEGRTWYIAQATRTHGGQAEAPGATSPGLQVKANGVRQTVRTSSEVQQHLSGPRQSSLLQFYSRKPDKIAGNSSHGNSHNKARQMDGSQLVLDATTAGAVPNANTPGRMRRGAGFEILARESEIDDEMWDSDGEVYEDAEDQPASSALGKRKAKAELCSAPEEESECVTDQRMHEKTGVESEDNDMTRLLDGYLRVFRSKLLQGCRRERTQGVLA